MALLLAAPAVLQDPAPTPWAPVESVVAIAAPVPEPARRDFRGFVERHRERVADSAVAYEVSQALEECYAVSVALAPSSPYVPVNAGLAWAEAAAAESLAAPCRGFEGQRIDPGEVLALLRRSASLGEPRARARMLLFRDVAAQKDDALRELPLLLATLDPGVVRDVGAFLARGETDVRLGSEAVPARVSAIAWELAACDLGYDCGPDARITLAQCAFGGNCGGGYEQALAASEAPDEWARARALRPALLRALLRHDWRWLGLQ
jgi:hypothetical protein